MMPGAKAHDGQQRRSMMESRVKLFGHPVHPILIVFPLGLLATSVIFDIIYLATGHVYLSEVAYWLIVAGILGGVVSAPFGLIDWLAIPAGTRAKRIGALHGMGNVVVLLLFALSWYIRTGAEAAPGAFAYVCAFLGAGLALLTGWLGGELVDRLGIGVDAGAHPDAPSSLSGRPAHERVSAGRQAR
jgi:uncharacterized membrane protein